MDIETVKKNREWKQTQSGIVLNMPTNEEVNWLIAAHERLTTELTTAKEEIARLTADNCKPSEAAETALEMERKETERLRPMHDAPKDGAEILAFHVDGGNFHPVSWQCGEWRMRWNREYCCGNGHYSGWLPYPKGE
jgi:hypothetical protein